MLNVIKLGIDAEVGFTKNGRLFPASELGLKKQGDVMQIPPGMETFTRLLPWEFMYKLHENGKSVFRDGPLGEFNTNPNVCRGIMTGAIKTCLGALKNFANNAEVEMTSLPLIKASPLVWKRKNFPEDSYLLGCNPSENAWGRKSPLEDVNPEKIPYRTTGAHLWFSKTGTAGIQDPSTHAKTVQWLDATVGVVATYLLNDVPGELKRRRLYGQVGEFRSRNFNGVNALEYRVCSGRILFDKSIYSLLTLIGRIICFRIDELPDIPASFGKLIQRAVMKGEEKDLLEVMEQIHMPTLYPVKVLKFAKAYYASRGINNPEKGFDVSWVLPGEAPARIFEDHIGWGEVILRGFVQGSKPFLDFNLRPQDISDIIDLGTYSDFDPRSYPVIWRNRMLGYKEKRKTPRKAAA